MNASKLGSMRASEVILALAGEHGDERVSARPAPDGRAFGNGDADVLEPAEERFAMTAGPHPPRDGLTGRSLSGGQVLADRGKFVAAAPDPVVGPRAVGGHVVEVAP